MSIRTEIELEAYSNTATFGSKWITDVLFFILFILYR